MKNDKLTVGVITAMTVEAEGIIAEMTETKEITVGAVKFVTGKLKNINCVVSVSGVGKVFAAICAQTMILTFKPDVIVNSGIAGTLTKELSVCDAAIATTLVQYDMDTSAIGDPYGMISGINMIHLPTDEKYSALLEEAVKETSDCRVLRGTIASGDKFIADRGEKEKIAAAFGAVACEMEGAAIGQVCYVNSVPCCVMRAISDGEGAEMDYPVFRSIAADRAVKMILSFFGKLNG